MPSLKSEKLNIQVGAITRAIINCDSEHDAKILLEIQKDLMEKYVDAKKEENKNEKETIISNDKFVKRKS